MDQLEKKLLQIKQANWESKRPYYQQYSQNTQAHMRPNSSISRGKFKPHPKLLGIYQAHPVTIRALKKDILLAGEDFSQFQDSRPCESCKQVVDRQFWHFCPYCESSWTL